ncbi:MAG: hypothetical protein Phog2KO_13350 [Phototrophicaceae bacterium]
MSEKDEKNIQRFGRGNRKNKLQKPKSLFPVEDAESVDETVPKKSDSTNDAVETEKQVSQPKTVEPVKAPTPKPAKPTPKETPPPKKVDFDFNSLNIPDDNAEVLDMLSSLHDEVKAPVITPQEDRYPPTAPTNRPKKTQAKQTVAPTRNSARNTFYNLMTLIVLIATCALIYWFVQVWNDPQSALNPLSPATPFVMITADPNTIVDTEIQATPDDAGQIFVVITDTPMPTASATDSPFAFITEPILYAPNTNDLACNWWSIAGTVSDLEGNPLTGYRVQIIGEDVSETVFSGASQAFGAGGYELPLIGTPREAAFVVQLFSAQEAPLSEEIFVSTRADCDANVTVVNFIQNR